jgi:hypothetical protein
MKETTRIQGFGLREDLLPELEGWFTWGEGEAILFKYLVMKVKGVDGAYAPT